MKRLFDTTYLFKIGRPPFQQYQMRIQFVSRKKSVPSDQLKIGNRVTKYRHVIRKFVFQLSLEFVRVNYALGINVREIALYALKRWEIVSPDRKGRLVVVNLS